MIEFKGSLKAFFKAYPKDKRSLDEVYCVVSYNAITKKETKTNYHFVGSLGEKSFKKIETAVFETKQVLNKTAAENSQVVKKPKDPKLNKAFNDDEVSEYGDRGMKLYDMIKATKKMTHTESLALGCVLTEYIFDADLKVDIDKNDVKGLLTELYDKYNDEKIRKEIAWFLDNYPRIIRTNTAWKKQKYKSYKFVAH